KLGKSHQDIMDMIWKSGRDNSRTPMQWNDTRNAGFTDGTPWMKVNPNYREVNVEQSLADADSIYHYYKKMIRLWKEHVVLIYGTYELAMSKHAHIYAYIRTSGDSKILILAYLFAEEKEVSLPDALCVAEAELLHANDTVDEVGLEKLMHFKTFEARVYRIS